MTSFIVKEESETIRHFKLSKCTPFYLKPQGSEEMCLSLEHGLEHQNPSKKPLKNWVILIAYSSVTHSIDRKPRD